MDAICGNAEAFYPYVEINPGVGGHKKDNSDNYQIRENEPCKVLQLSP